MRGSSAMVAHHSSKVDVAGSSPVSRSNEFTASIKFEAVNYLMAGIVLAWREGTDGGFDT